MQAYHQAHLEAIKGFGMHGYEIEFENLVEEYQVGKHNNYLPFGLTREKLPQGSLALTLVPSE